MLADDCFSSNRRRYLFRQYNRRVKCPDDCVPIRLIILLEGMNPTVTLVQKEMLIDTLHADFNEGAEQSHSGIRFLKDNQFLDVVSLSREHKPQVLYRLGKCVVCCLTHGNAFLLALIALPSGELAR